MRLVGRRRLERVIRPMSDPVEQTEDRMTPAQVVAERRWHAAVTLAVQFSAAPGKGGNIHQMLEWADEINDYLVDGSLKGKEA